MSSPATGAAAIEARTSTTTYDSRGQFPVVAANALGQSETRSFDPNFGAVTSLTGPNGLTTQWQYDSFGRKTLEIRADGTRTQWSYQYCNGVYTGTAACPSLAKYLVQTTPLAADGVTPNGPTSKAYYDALDRVIRTETQGFNGALIYQDTQYDSKGRVDRTSRPYYSNQTRNGRPSPTTVSTVRLPPRCQMARKPLSSTAASLRAPPMRSVKPKSRKRIAKAKSSKSPMPPTTASRTNTMLLAT